MTSHAGETGLTAHDSARRFLECLSAQDFDRLATVFADDVHLRALLPGDMKEWHGAARVTATFIRWFGNTQEFELVDVGIDELPNRVHMWWRARLRAERLGAGWFIVEQQAYLDTDDTDRIGRLSLVCSGYLPEMITL